MLSNGVAVELLFRHYPLTRPLTFTRALELYLVRRVPLK
jgi:hypothetical protein